MSKLKGTQQSKNICIETDMSANAARGDMCAHVHVSPRAAFAGPEGLRRGIFKYGSQAHRAGHRIHKLRAETHTTRKQ